MDDRVVILDFEGVFCYAVGMFLRLCKFVHFLVRLAVMLGLLLVMGAVVLLFVVDQGVPERWVAKLTRAVSSDSCVVTVRKLRFNIWRGLIAEEIRLSVPEAERPFGSIGLVTVQVRPSFSLPGVDWIRGVEAHQVRMTSLPPPDLDAPPKARKHDLDTEIAFDDIAVRLTGVNILDITAEEARCIVSAKDGNGISAKDVYITWNDPLRRQEKVTGSARVDLDKQYVYADLRGATIPSRLYPLFKLLKLGVVEEYCRLFDFAPDGVIDATCGLTISFGAGDNTTLIEIGAEGSNFSYRDEPLKHVKGRISINGRNTKIGPLRAEHESGYLEGFLYNTAADHMLYFDAKAQMNPQAMTRIINQVEKPATNFTFNAGVTLSMTGSLYTVKTPLESVYLNGKFEAGAGTVFQIPVESGKVDLVMTNGVVNFDNVVATANGNGVATGNFRLYFKPETPLRFTTEGAFTNISMAAFDAFFKSPGQESLGMLSGTLALDGDLEGEHPVRRLNGWGKGVIEHGRLNRVKLFAGFTDYLAKNVPGVEMLVDQTKADFDLTVTNGVISIVSIDISGDVFGVRMHGTYAISPDVLNMTARTVFFQDKSIARRLTAYLAYPMSRLFMQFRLSGSLGTPVWTYVGLLERMGLTGSDTQSQ